MNLRNKTAIVTGGLSGIGKAIVNRFLPEGIKVIVFDIQKTETAAELKHCDITDEEQIKRAFENIASLDILVNNAGIYLQASVEETTQEQLEKIMNINFKGAFLMCKHALGLLKKSKGTIINISSCLGIIPEPAAPAYCASKAAIVMLTKTMSQAYAKDSIRINAVLPGPIDTPLLDKFFKNQQEKEKYFANKPFGRIGKAEEVANVVKFLASDESSFVTGGIYTVDGGESASSLYTK